VKLLGASENVLREEHCSAFRPVRRNFRRSGRWKAGRRNGLKMESVLWALGCRGERRREGGVREGGRGGVAGRRRGKKKKVGSGPLVRGCTNRLRCARGGSGGKR